jgi:hypothetical protein
MTCQSPYPTVTVDLGSLGIRDPLEVSTQGLKRLLSVTSECGGRKID